MTDKSNEIEDRRKEDERIWWNKFSTVMAKSWEMTPRLNSVLRKQLINDYTCFLFKKDGKLLDVGCGNGWISEHFASMGMNVIGVDFSIEQINFAKQEIYKNETLKKSISFVCADIVNLNKENVGENFDSIIVSALLHHLTPLERKNVLTNLSNLLSEKGKIYLYEPVFFEEEKNRNKFYQNTYMALVIINRFIFKVIRNLNLLTNEYKQAKKSGYAGKSPHEEFFSFNEIKQGLPKELYIESVKPFHGFNIRWGTFQMTLKPVPQYVLRIFTPLINRIDNYLLRLSYWKSITNKTWILSGIKIQKT